jgi:hypothetical protein
VTNRCGSSDREPTRAAGRRRLGAVFAEGASAFLSRRFGSARSTVRNGFLTVPTLPHMFLCAMMIEDAFHIDGPWRDTDRRQGNPDVSGWKK